MSEIRKNTEESCYEILVDGAVVGFAEYEVDGDTVTAPHTEVDPGHGGKGYAGKIVEQLLADAKSAGQDVLPVCPYVASYIGKHPEYLELVPEEQRARFRLA